MGMTKAEAFLGTTRLLRDARTFFAEASAAMSQPVSANLVLYEVMSRLGEVRRCILRGKEFDSATGGSLAARVREEYGRPDLDVVGVLMSVRLGCEAALGEIGPLLGPDGDGFVRVVRLELDAGGLPTGVAVRALQASETTALRAALDGIAIPDWI